jgi:NitT/TauT family transport system substrate-binding protein
MVHLPKPTTLRKAGAVYVTILGLFWLILEPMSAFGLAQDFLRRQGLVGYLILFGIPGFAAAGYLLWFALVRPELEKVVVCQFHQCVQYLPLYLAEAKGFFRKRGIAVEINSAFGDHRAWEEVRNGNAHFGLADPLMMLPDDSLKGKIIASIVAKVSMDGITRKPMAPLKAITDLKGLVVAVYERPSSAFMIAQFMQCTVEAAGGSLTVAEMKPGNELSYLDDGSVDIVFLTEPQATAATDAGAHRVFVSSRIFGPCVLSGIFTTERLIRENRDLVRRFVESIEESLRFIRTNAPGTLQIAASIFPASRNFTTERAILRLLAESVLAKHTTVLEECWHRLLRIRHGPTSHLFRFSDFVDNSFADDAVRRFDGKKGALF